MSSLGRHTYAIALFLLGCPGGFERLPVWRDFIVSLPEGLLLLCPGSATKSNHSANNRIKALICRLQVIISCLWVITHAKFQTGFLEAVQIPLDHPPFSCLKNILFIYFFRERVRGGGEREGEKHQLVASWTSLTGDQTHTLRHVLWLGIEPATLHPVGWCPTHWPAPVMTTIFLHKLLCSISHLHA